MTTTEQAATPVLPCDGHMACDLCGVVYPHAVVLDHPNLTPRQQLRQAASRAGWRQTVDGRDVCPVDVSGEAAFLIPGWTVFWSPETSLVPLQRDPEATLTMPAVAEPVPAGRRPYDFPRGAA